MVKMPLEIAFALASAASATVIVTAIRFFA